VAPDFLEVCTHIRQHLRKRALLVFLTALDDPALAETFERGIDLLVRQHLIFVHMIRPFGSVPLFSGVVPENLNDAYHQLAGHLTWRDLRELEKSLQRKGVRLTQSQATDLTARIVKQLGDAKDRQLL
jgi:CheY-like chemotaxis protein